MQKKALVTGVSGKIGNAIAKKLLEKGYLVYGTYLTRTIEKMKGDFLPVKLDVRDSKAIFNLASQIGRVDVLVNNAGIASMSEFLHIKEREWDDILNVNLKGYFLCTQTFLPKMLEKKSGIIINITSILGLNGASCEVHYSASKAGIIGLTKALAKEVGPSGIRVNAVAPGFIETSMTEGFSDDTRNMLASVTSLRRNGQAVDVAEAVDMLIESSFITGEVINVSGGLLI